MWNKTHSQSNEETEDGEEEDREMNVKSLLEENIPIIDVWAHNFDHQLKVLAALAQTYNVIAFVQHRLSRIQNSRAISSKSIPLLPTTIKKK
jgi:hypothetical protein